MITLFIPQALSILVLVSNIVFLVVLALFVFSEHTRRRIIRHISDLPAEHIFIFSFLAMIGSLALSQIVGFSPCELCWVQRICMYPQVVITLVALFRKKKSEVIDVVYYCLPLSVIGAGISLFQSYVQWTGSSTLLSCTLNGGACGKLYVYAFNYITIPFMSFSVFVYLISISLVFIYGRKHTS